MRYYKVNNKKVQYSNSRTWPPKKINGQVVTYCVTTTIWTRSKFGLNTEDKTNLNLNSILTHKNWIYYICSSKIVTDNIRENIIINSNFEGT